jgi:RNA polymerase sigma-70 factor (ECF subfamily)
LLDGEIHPSDQGDTETMVKQCREGDRAAFARLHTEYYPRVARFAASRGMSEHDADEVAAETFITIWKQIPRFQFSGVPFICWVMAIAERHTLAAGRKIGRNAGSALSDVSDLAMGAEDPHSIGDERTALLQLVNRLPERSKRIIALRFFGGMSAAEVAELVSDTEANVRQVQFQALKKLRGLAQSGGVIL